MGIIVKSDGECCGTIKFVHGSILIDGILSLPCKKIFPFIIRDYKKYWQMCESVQNESSF